MSEQEPLEEPGDPSQPPNRTSLGLTRRCVIAVTAAALLTVLCWWCIRHAELSPFAAGLSAYYFAVVISLSCLATPTALLTICVGGTVVARANWVERAVAALLIVPVLVLQSGVYVLGFVFSAKLLDPRVQGCSDVGCGWLPPLLFVSIILTWARAHTPPAWEVCTGGYAKVASEAGGAVGVKPEKKACRGWFVYDLVSPFLFSRKDFFENSKILKI